MEKDSREDKGTDRKMDKGLRTTSVTALLIMTVMITTACGEVKGTAQPDAMKKIEAGAKTDAAGKTETAANTEAAKGSVSAGQGAVSGEKADAVSAGITGAHYPDEKYADDIDSMLDQTVYTRTRTNDEDSGDIVDTSVYRDKDGDILKTDTDDYGSDGLIHTEYYYQNDEPVYIRQTKTDIYGIGSTETGVDLSDPSADYTAELIRQAGEVLRNAKTDAGKVLIYGYVGDEQGGMLKNVNVSLRNLSADITAETVTDDDGYYSLEMPQTDETYNLTYTYGDWQTGSLNDIHIVPGTPEYSLGRVYIAPAGKAVHDTDTYLLNANTKAPTAIRDGEYAAVVTAETPGIALKLINKQDGRREAGNMIVFDPADSDKGYVLFAEDSVHIGKDDMSGNMGTCSAKVTIYDKNGIRAAYLAPVGRLGTLWRVCDIDRAGELSVSGILYTGTEGWK